MSLLNKLCKFSLSKSFEKNGFLSGFSPTQCHFEIIIPCNHKGGGKVEGTTWLGRHSSKRGCFAEPEPDGAKLRSADAGREEATGGWQRCCGVWPASEGCLRPCQPARSRR